MQGSTSLQLPASDPPSPSSDGGAKSSRVCLNCRRKKKKCDKKLPSCGRCTYSLEFCQHEDDRVSSRPAESSARSSFEAFGNISVTGPYAIHPFLGSQQSPVISPALFEPLETTDNVHSFVSRSLAQIIGDRTATESIVRYYFGTINAWFTIIESTSFEERLDQMWAEPSAETGLLAVCMLLIVRSPEEGAAVSMQNSLYHSVKTLWGIVAAKMPLSTSVLQANLLICLYELGHLMPQQAYLTLSTCVSIVRAFGWLDESFWGQDQWILRAKELKMCSVIWWAMVFLESSLQCQELGYPQVVSSFTFTIPFPETFDPLLHLVQGSSPQYEDTLRFADDGDSRVETIVFPEAKSASLLCQVLAQTKSSAFPPQARETLHAAVLDHARTIVSTPWKDGSRFAALSLAYIAVLKLNHPQLSIGRSSRIIFSSNDRNLLQSTVHVIDSICHSAQLITSSSGSLCFLGPLVPTLAHSVFLASKVLVESAGALAQGADFSNKIQLLRSCLELFAKRWKVAGESPPANAQAAELLERLTGLNRSIRASAQCSDSGPNGPDVTPTTIDEPQTTGTTVFIARAGTLPGRARNIAMATHKGAGRLRKKADHIQVGVTESDAVMDNVEDVTISLWLDPKGAGWETVDRRQAPGGRRRQYQEK